MQVRKIYSFTEIMKDEHLLGECVYETLVLKDIRITIKWWIPSREKSQLWIKKRNIKEQGKAVFLCFHAICTGNHNMDSSKGLHGYNYCFPVQERGIKNTFKN